MPERRTLYDGDEVVYPRTIASEVYVSDGVTFEDEIAENLALVQRAEQVLIDGIKDYKTYTVRIDLNNSDPETACEYMDNAVGKTLGYDGWKDTDLIKNIKPCVLNNGEVQYYLQKDNYTLKEDGTTSVLDGTDGDVMVEIPKIGYRLWSDGSYQYVSVTNDPAKADYCYYAHSLNSAGDCDKIYYGAYYGYVNGNNLYSRSEISPTVRTSLINFRSYAANRGTGYSLESFFPRTLMQCLYVIMYKNLNSQVALGQGLTSASTKVNTGGTNLQNFCYGTASGSNQVKFLGIEDFWGNIYGWLDGVYSDSSCNILTDYRNSQFTGSGHDFQFNAGQGANNNWGYISKILGNNTSGFVPAEVNGSDSTYFADEGNVRFGNFGRCGGNWGGGADAGAFFLYLSASASNSYSYLGARLMYKHKSN